MDCGNVVEPDGYEDLLADSTEPTTVSNMVPPAVLQVLLRIRYSSGG